MRKIMLLSISIIVFGSGCMYVDDPLQKQALDDAEAIKAQSFQNMNSVPMGNRLEMMNMQERLRIKKSNPMNNYNILSRGGVNE